MRKKSGITFCSIFFLAMLIIWSYCLLEFRNDYITIGGVSIVLLISAYLLITSVQESIKSFAEEYLNPVDQYEESNKLQKATYVAIKKMEVFLEERMKSMEEVNISCIDELIASLRETLKPLEEYNMQIDKNQKIASSDMNDLITAVYDAVEKLTDMRLSKDNAESLNPPAAELKDDNK